MCGACSLSPLWAPIASPHRAPTRSSPPICAPRARRTGTCRHGQGSTGPSSDRGGDRRPGPRPGRPGRVHWTGVRHARRRGGGAGRAAGRAAHGRADAGADQRGHAGGRSGQCRHHLRPNPATGGQAKPRPGLRLGRRFLSPPPSRSTTLRASVSRQLGSPSGCVEPLDARWRCARVTTDDIPATAPPASGCLPLLRRETPRHPVATLRYRLRAAAVACAAALAALSACSTGQTSTNTGTSSKKHTGTIRSPTSRSRAVKATSSMR